MRKISLFPVILCLLTSLIITAAQDDNLLNNPGFEAPYEDVDEEDQVAEGWIAWSVGTEAERPLYSPASLEDADRIREGEDAQKYSSFLSTHTAGVYQTITGLPAGATVTFSIYVYVWSTRDDSDRAVSVDPGGVTVEVGIDPTGSTDPQSLTILWSEPQEAYDEYVLYEISAAAEDDAVTVFVRSTVAEPVLLTDIFLDEAVLVIADPADLTPDATPDIDIIITDEPTIEVMIPDATPTDIPTDAPTVEIIIVPTETPTEAPTDLPTELPTDDPFPATQTAVALDQTATALVAQQTNIAATLTAVQVIIPTGTETPTDIPTEAATATPDANENATAEALQMLATQGQIDFLTAVAEGELTATAAMAPPTATDLPPTTTETSTPQPTPMPQVQTVVQTVVVVITATPEPTEEAAATPAATEQSETPPEAQISPELAEAFPERVFHTVQRGETVVGLAAFYNSSAQAIIEVNGLKENGLIFVNQLLVIPVREASAGAQPPAVGQVAATPTSAIILTGNEQTYTVQRGDTLSAIASKFNTTVTALAQLNGIVNVNSLRVGQVVFVPGPPQPLPAPEPVTYVVQYGDTLARIALRFNVPAQRIIEANQIANANLIYAGQVLIIP